MISDLIDLLKYAPSGGNMQPWVLKTLETDKSISVTIHLNSNIRFEEQHTDHCGYGAFISLGALAYSIQYLSQDFGYRLVTKNFHWDADLSKSFILVILESCEPIPTKRPEIFRRRFTDRRPFETTPLKANIKENLGVQFGTSLRIFEDAGQRECILNAFKQLSLIRFQNKDLFKELSHELKTDSNEATGIPISNLGLSLPLSLLTRLQRTFPLRFPIAAAYAWPIYESLTRPMKNSSALACLTLEGDDSKNWMQLGETLMHVWLWLAEAGLRMQPFGNTLSIANYFQDPQFFTFSARQIQLTKDLHMKIKNELNVDTAKPCLFFRIGYSNQPAQETPRKNIETMT